MGCAACVVTVAPTVFAALTWGCCGSQEATTRVLQLIALPMPRLAVDAMDSKTLRSTLTQQLQAVFAPFRTCPAGGSLVTTTLTAHCPAAEGSHQQRAAGASAKVSQGEERVQGGEGGTTVDSVHRTTSRSVCAPLLLVPWFWIRVGNLSSDSNSVAQALATAEARSEKFWDKFKEAEGKLSTLAPKLEVRPCPSHSGTYGCRRRV